MAAEPRNEGQVEVEDILQPLDGRRGLVCQNLDEVRSRLVTGRFEGIFIKLLNAVANLVVDLGPGEGAVDAGRRLC